MHEEDVRLHGQQEDVQLQGQQEDVLQQAVNGYLVQPAAHLQILQEGIEVEKMLNTAENSPVESTAPGAETKVAFSYQSQSASIPIEHYEPKWVEECIADRHPRPLPHKVRGVQDRSCSVDPCIYMQPAGAQNSVSSSISTQPGGVNNICSVSSSSSTQPDDAQHGCSVSSSISTQPPGAKLVCSVSPNNCMQSKDKHKHQE